MFVYTVPDLLFREQTDKDALFVIENDISISRSALNKRASVLASWLYDQGIRRGDRVGIHLMKSIDEIVATFAISRIGAVWVNVNYQWVPDQLEYVIEDSGMKILFTDTRKARQLKDSLQFQKLGAVVLSGKMTSVNSSHISINDACSTTFVPESYRPVDKDLAALLYTSGSTGKPKGVMISHLNFIDATRRVSEYLVNSKSDTILSVIPLSAPWGVLQITTMLMSGGAVVLQPTVLPSEIVNYVNKHNITGIAAMPPTWVQLSGYLQETQIKLPSLRYISSSGGKIPHQVLESFPEVFPDVSVYLTYGLTEAFRSTYLAPEMFRKKMGSLGKPCKNVDVFVIDPEKGICGPGEQGELVHRGSVVTMGYWNNQKATDQNWKTCEHLRHLIGDELVHYSNDLVRIDEDGYLWFVDRMVSQIKCAGHRISSTEVEDICCQSGFIESAVAFGVPDLIMGQIVHVAIDVKPGCEQSFNEEDLLQYCKRRMPNFMVPARFHVWNGLMPRNPNGKIDRPLVINFYLEVLKCEESISLQS